MPQIPLPVALGLCLFCLVLGFLIGTRARQMVASLKMARKAAWSWAMLQAPASDDDKDGEDDKDGVNEDELSGDPTIDDFLSLSGNTGFEDHPDTEFNPVLMYQVKVARDVERERKRQLAMAALEDGGDTGAQAVDANLGKQNALALLVSIGARTLPASSKGKAEDTLIQERKRQQKNIDVFIGKEYGIDTKSTAPGKNEAAKLALRGDKLKSAIQVARETQFDRHGGSTGKRVDANVFIAKFGRNSMREYKRMNPKKFEELDDDDDDETEKVDMRGRNTGAVLDPKMLAQIAAEFDGEEFDGEEGGADPDVDLAA